MKYQVTARGQTPDDRSTRRTVAALGVAQTIAWASSYYLPAVLASSIARELAVQPSLIFGAMSMALLIAGLAGPWAGRWVDQHGGRGLLCLSNLTFAGGLTLMASTETIAGLYIAWVLMGLGMAIGLYETAFATLATTFGPAARAPITGVALIAGFASTIGWPLSMWLEIQLGWRGVCFAWALAHITLGLALNWFFVPCGSHFSKDPHGNRATTEGSEASAGGPRLLAMLLLAFVFAATWFVSTAMAAHLPRLLVMFGASADAALMAAIVVGPAQVVARMAEFSLIARIHPLTSAKIASIAHPIGALALTLGGAPMALVFASLHGAGNGILTISKGTLPLMIFGPKDYGQIQGWLSAPARLLQAGAPFLFGLMLEGAGTTAILLTAILSLSSFVALLLLDRFPTKR